MCESEAVEKNMTVGTGRNAYKAVSEAALLNIVKPLFKKYKLIIFPISGDIAESVTVYNKTDYDGKSIRTLWASGMVRTHKTKVQEKHLLTALKMR